MDKKDVKYQCSVNFGYTREKLWVKSAEYSGNSVVLNLSPEPCSISAELCNAASPLLMCATKRPFKKISVMYSQITDIDFSARSEEVTVDE